MTDPSSDAPLVSVVIPAHNARKFILEAVRSVLAQTIRSLEVVVVDDGSTDGTAEELQTISDPRVHIIRQENRGTSAARNAALRTIRATGYVAFLDADDCWDPRKLEAQITFLRARPDLVIVGSYMRYISSKGRVLGRTGATVGPERQESIRSGKNFPFPLSSFLVRREAMDLIGGFDEDLGCPAGGPEDIELLARLAAHGRVECVPVVLGSYRVHPTSAMATNRRNINRAAAFVRHRLAARRQGRDLTREEFVAKYPVSWADLKRDITEVYYRKAALWYGEERPVRAALSGFVAFALGPVYTLRRVRRQRFSLHEDALAADGRAEPSIIEEDALR